MKFYDLILIGRKVHGSLPCKVRSQYRSGIQRDLPSLILNVSRIYISIGVFISSKCREFEKLFISVGTIISQVQSQAVLQEFPFHTQFDRMCHFRFHLRKRSGITCQHSSAGSHIRYGISNEGRYPVAYNAISSA